MQKREDFAEGNFVQETEKGKDCIGVQDIPIPEEEPNVNDSKNEEPNRAPIVNICAFDPSPRFF